MKKVLFVLLSLVLLSTSQPAEAFGLDSIKSGLNKAVHKVGTFTVGVVKELPKDIAISVTTAVATIELVPIILPLIVL